MTSSPLQRTRAYGQIEGRQQRDDRLVSSALELRTMLEEAANAGAPLHVRLACDLELDEGITIPEAVPAFTMGGGKKYRILYVAALAYVFRTTAINQDVLIEDLDAEGNGSSTATVFVTTSASGHNRLRIEGVRILNTLDLFDPAASFVAASVVNSSFNDDIAAATADVRGSLSFLRMINVRGAFNVTLSTANGAVLVGVQSTGAYASTSSTAVIVGSVFQGGISPAAGDVVAATGSTTQLRGRLEVVPPDVNGINLAGVNPTMTILVSLVRFDINTSSGNLTLSDGVADGHRATLYCTGNLGGGVLTLPDNTANNVRLSAAWVPTSFDTLRLFWDATDGNWIEEGRSTN